MTQGTDARVQKRGERSEVHDRSRQPDLRREKNPSSPSDLAEQRMRCGRIFSKGQRSSCRQSEKREKQRKRKCGGWVRSTVPQRNTIEADVVITLKGRKAPLAPRTFISCPGNV